jgi:hypothetical protein
MLFYSPEQLPIEGPSLYKGKGGRMRERERERERENPYPKEWDRERKIHHSAFYGNMPSVVRHTPHHVQYPFLEDRYPSRVLACYLLSN